MIWADHQIYSWARSGGLTPFDPSCINPASIDLRLGDTYREPVLSKDFGYIWGDEQYIPDEGLALTPGCFVLCCSLEYTSIPNNAAAKLFLKSTTGRSGIEHLHAGFGDPGFEGNWTFELTNHWPGPVYVYSGQRLFQLTLESLESQPTETYAKTGRYFKQTGVTVPQAISNR